MLSCFSKNNADEHRVKDSVPLIDTTHTIDSFTLSNKELEKTWKVFANAILIGNKKIIKDISTNCVYCTDCPTNTRQEDSLFNEYQKKNPKIWYDKLSSEFSYISIDEFLTNDYPLIFDSIVNTRLFNQSKIRFFDEETNKNLYKKNCIINSQALKESTIIQLFVKTIDWSEENEGMDKVFSFIKTKQGYKFCGYWTLP